MTESNIVVYTAIFEDYDVLLQPAIVPENVDFICYTDNLDTVQGIWEPQLVSDYDISPKLKSGKVKLLPHHYFPDYDYSIWIDGNIHVIGDVRDLIEQTLQNVNMAVPPHPRRDCIYDEAVACIEQNKANPDLIREQMERYRNMDFPENYGLSETRILVRRHNEIDVIRVMELWWNEFQRGAERDQLSFEFAAWKSDLQYLPSNFDYSSRTGYFHLHPHKPQGLKGEIWEFALRKREENSGRKARLFALLFVVIAYLFQAYQIYSEKGFVVLLKSTIKFLSRECGFYRNTIPNK